MPPILKDVIRYAAWFRRFVAYVGRRFLADNCLQIAAALAYTSLLSLVPLMAVTFSMLAAFPVFESISQQLQDFVFANLVPASGDAVQGHLHEFASKASRLTMVGIGVLVLTALMMMATIDKALNSIWRSHGQRGEGARFLVYWAVLSLGPVLVGMGLVATSYVASLPFLVDTHGVAEVRTLGLRLLPLLTTALAFTLMYLVIPARSVPLRPALIGGVFAGLLFEAAKRGFTLYVTHFPTYEAIYGALASIPIFLIWIYLSWVIILLGAIVAHSLIVYREDPAGYTTSRPGHRFLVATRVVGRLWLAQRKGVDLSERTLIKQEKRFTGDVLAEVLKDLRAARVVQRTDRGRWVLARDPSELTLLDLYRGVPGQLSATSFLVGDPDPWERSMDAALVRAGKGLEAALNISVHNVLGLGTEPPAYLTEQPGHPLPGMVDSQLEAQVLAADDDPPSRTG